MPHCPTAIEMTCSLLSRQNQAQWRALHVCAERHNPRGPLAQSDGFPHLPRKRRTPEERVGMPEERGGLPEERPGMPEEHRGMPDEQVGMPEEHRGMPEKQVGMLDEQVGMPDE
jgi:hypothetical protein